MGEAARCFQTVSSLKERRDTAGGAHFPKELKDAQGGGVGVRAADEEMNSGFVDGLGAGGGGVEGSAYDTPSIGHC